MNILKLTGKKYEDQETESFTIIWVWTTPFIWEIRENHLPGLRIDLSAMKS